MPGAPALELPEASLAVHRHRKNTEKSTKNRQKILHILSPALGIYEGYIYMSIPFIIYAWHVDGVENPYTESPG